jgi:uncharacterized protein
MTKEFDARRLDVKTFAEDGGRVSGEAPAGKHTRLMAETQGRGADAPVAWSALGEIRNAGHVQPEIWLHLKANADLALTCQRCLAPVDVAVSVDRSFRFVSDEDAAAAQDNQAEEDVLALSRNFDLVELVEDELLMELPIAPRHETCPPVKLALADQAFEDSSPRQEKPFALLGKLKTGRS